MSIGRRTKTITRFLGCLVKSMVAGRYRRHQSYHYQLAIAAIIKNEESYIEEWIKYHKIAGVDKFYIYNNGSTDKTAAILARYIESGLVELIDFPGTARQFPAYNDALKKYKNECKYIVFIDADEFLVSCNKEKKLVQVIDEILALDDKAAGVAVNWRMYGSSGHIAKPGGGGVLENFLWRAKEDGRGNDCIKTIVNPRCVYGWYHPHYPQYLMPWHSIDEEGRLVSGWSNPKDELHKIRINHYFTKSKEEWTVRRGMGKADKKNPDKNKRTMEEFYLHDNNDIFDDSMLYYVEQMR